MPKVPKVVIVGGVAGGASCAARLRRQQEFFEIILIDRGKYVSFANCGLPYYVGEVIQHEKDLLVATPELFEQRFNIHVRTEHEVVSIDREQKQILINNLKTNTSYRESYDVLVLSPGASPIKPGLPGVDLPGVFVLKTIPDSNQIREWIKHYQVQKTIVVGGGFIGLEMTENLMKRGIQVTLIEKLSQIMPPLDAEIARPLQEHLKTLGVQLQLNNGLVAIESSQAGQLAVKTQTGEKFEAEMVLLTIGVRPEVQLAKNASLQLGTLGGIQVDDEMKTSDPSIFAIGDAVEVVSYGTGRKALIPLAGPANRQGRLVADGIAGKPRKFRGVQGTAVCGFLGMTAALTGETEKTLRAAKYLKYEKIYLYPGHHVSYYPNAKPIFLKLLFEQATGQILGAQAVGEEGVEKRIDVIAMAIQMKATVFDLEDAELCYAPQYGAAKDPVNMAGMIAANIMRGTLKVADWSGVHQNNIFLLDVRDESEFQREHIPGAVNIPLHQLRMRLDQIPRDRSIWVYCGVGQRSYYAYRILDQNGFPVFNLSGGFLTYQNIFDKNASEVKKSEG
jgi:NADPH-dependent 2,4-dienoyl-CoA reductase/sulfur reductase-like enzyme/rhodanese-related sulfurtransferase